MQETKLSKMKKEDLIREVKKLQKKIARIEKSKKDKDLKKYKSLLKNELNNKNDFEKKLRESEEKFRKTFAATSDAISINRFSDELYISVNNGFTNLTGYSETDVLGKTSLEIGIWVHIKDRNRFLRELGKKGNVDKLEAKFRMKNGKMFDGLISAATIDLNGVMHVVSIIRNVTGLKSAKEQIEISESSLNALINNSNGAIWSLDENLNYINFNDLFRENYKTVYNIELKNGLNAIEILTPELRAFWKTKYDAALSGKKLDFEFSAEMNNEIKYYEVYLNPIISNGIVTGISALSVDTTQRKKAENALSQRENLLQVVFNNTQDLQLLVSVNKEGELNVAAVNNKYIETVRHFGFNVSMQDIVGLSLERLNTEVYGIRGELHEKTIMRYRQVAESGLPLYYQEELETSTGHYYGQISLVPVINSFGKCDFILYTSHNITELKQVEKTVRENKLRLESIVSNAPVVLFTLDKNGIFTFSEGKGLQSLGLKPGEAIGLSALEMYKDFPSIIQAIQQALKGEINSAIHDMGNLIFDVNYSPIKNSEGEIIGVIGVANDITKRKKAELELVKRQGLISATLLSIGEALISTDSKGNITMMNPVAENLTGWKLTECTGKNINEIFTIVNAKSGEKVVNPIERTLKEGVIVGLANHTKLISRHGTEYQIADSCAPIKDENGKVLGAVLVFRNVTEEYIWREKLIISDQAIKNSINGIALSDLNGKINFVNSSFIKMWGYSNEDQIIGKVIYEFWNNPEEARIVIKKIFDNSFYTTELKAKRADGSLFDVLLTANFISDPDGNLLALFGSFIDITERKKAEEELLVNNITQRAVLNNIPDIVWLKDLDSKFLVVNEAFAEATGLSADKIIGKTDLEIWPTEQAEGYRKDDIEVMQSGKQKKIIEQIIDKHGKITWAETIKSPVLDNENHVIGTAGTARDFTERKKIEEALAESQNLLQIVLNTIPVRVFWKDRNLRYIGCNIHFANDAGLTLPEEIIGKFDSELSWYRQADLYNTDDKKVITSGRAKLNYEEPQTTPDGKNIILRTSKIPLKDDSGNIIGLLGTYEDISLQKKAEEALQQANLVVENSSSVLFRWKAVEGWPVVFVSHNVLQFGYNSYELLNGSIQFISIIHPDDRERVRKEVSEYTDSGVSRFKQEYRIMSKDGIIHWIDDRTVVERNSDGIVTHYQGILTDITDRKRVEEALNTKSAQMEAFLEHSPYAIQLFDRQGHCVYVNKAFQSLFPTIPPPQWSIFDDVQLLAAGFGKMFERLNQGETINLPPMWFKPDRSIPGEPGNERCVTEVVFPLLDNAGQIHQFALIGQDVTEQKIAEEALRKSEDRYKTLSQNTSDFTFACLKTEKGYKIDWMAGATLKLTGYSIDEILERGCWRFLVHKEDDEIFKNNVLEIPVGKNSECELRIISKDNVLKWMRVNTTCLLSDEKNTEIVYGGCSEITAQKIAEESLRASEQKYRMLFETNPHPMWVYDLETLAFLTVNDAAIVKYGYSKDEFLKMNIKQIRPPEDVVKLIENIKAVENGLDEAGIWRHLKKDGSLIYVEIVSHTLKFEGRKAEMILAHDVTERILAERQLKESQERLSLTLSSTRQGIYDLNVQTGKAVVTPEYATMLGYDPNTFKESNENWIERLHPDDRETTAKAYLDYIEGKTSEYRMEFRQRTADNQWKWILSLGKIVEYDSDGKPLRMLGTHTDITVQKKTEKDIKRLSRAVEQSPAIIMITNTDGDIEYVNSKFIEVTGYSFNEVLGKNPRILKSGKTSLEEYKNLWETISNRNEWRGEFLNRKKNGELYWESAFISPLLNETGNVTNYIAVKEDITERKRITKELIEAKEKAEEMNRVKAFFFANMSHELRTPFVGIMGFSEILSESLQNPEEKEMAEQILRSSKRLTDTLNKILNVTRLEFDKLDIKLTPVNVVEMISQTATLFSKSAAMQNTIIKTVFSPDIIKVNSDDKLLEEILSNLLNNAVKFTTNGIIEIKALLKTNKDRKTLLLTVSDTGVGIPKEKQKLIWEEFRQVSEGLNRSFEGTGLGLTLIKKYVTTLGGTIKLESEFGKGSTFFVEIPVVEVTDVQVTPTVPFVDPEIKKSIDTLNSKVLYVEDDIIALNYVTIVLKSICKIDTAFNATIAYEKVCSEKYDVLLLDINLGKDIDGVELMKKIRKVGGYSDIPIIAVTAYADIKDKEEFLTQGFTHYLSKPFTSTELKDLLIKVLS